MINLTEISTLNDPALAPYASLTEAQLRSGAALQGPVFIAESPKVINVALDAGYEPISLLCERKHIEGDAASIIERCPEMPVYTGSRELLASLTGYTLTRGVLCAMRRPQAPSLSSVLEHARRIAVLDSVTDTTNIGAIFRSAAALGFDAVLLTPRTCDPFNRRSIRCSMGSVFLVPWTWLPDPAVETLREHGFKSAAMALRPGSLNIDDSVFMAIDRLALFLGTEGTGLPQHLIDACDHTITIPMAHNVDSLNVAAAAAIAFWQLRPRS